MNELETKFIIPSMEGQIIDLKDYPKFKTKINFDPKTNAAKIACEVALNLLEKVDITDLATHFTNQFNALVELKAIEFRARPKIEDLTPQDNDVA